MLKWYVYFLPIVFLYEKEVFSNLPLFIPEHLYFHYSLLALPLLYLSKSLKMPSKNMVIFLLIVIFNFMLALVFYEDVMLFKESIAGLMRVLYFCYLGWVIKMLFLKKRFFYFYIRGLTVAFYLLAFITFVQISVIYLDLNIITTLSDSLAFLYEARWPAFEGVMGGVHNYYMNGSYATTIGRINGFSKEASTYSIGLTLTFAPFFLWVAACQGKDRILNPKEYKFYLVLIIIFLILAKTSTGLVLALSIVLIWFFLVGHEQLLVKVIYILLGGFIFVGFVYMFVDPEKIEKLYSLDVQSTMTRYGTVYASIKTLFLNPFIGLGDGFHRGIFENIPYWAFYGNREFELYYDESNIRAFSLVISFIGEYGIIATIFISVYYYRILKKYRKFSSAGKVLITSQVIFFVLSSLALASYMHPFVFLSAATLYATYNNKPISNELC